MYNLQQIMAAEDVPLLECGFSFGNKFREYFSGVTGVRKICIL